MSRPEPIGRGLSHSDLTTYDSSLKLDFTQVAGTNGIPSNVSSETLPGCLAA